MPRVVAFALLAAILLLARECRGQVADPASWWLNVGGVSQHEQPGYNERNPGLALEARWSDTWAATLGQMRNSEGRTSSLAAALYTPAHVDVPVLGRVHVGGIVGMADGYSRNGGQPIPVAGLLADRRWDRIAVAVVALPRIDQQASAAVVVFFRWRFR